MDGTRFFLTTINQRFSGALKMADDEGGRAMQTGWVRFFNDQLLLQPSAGVLLLTSCQHTNDK